MNLKCLLKTLLVADFTLGFQILSPRCNTIQSMRNRAGDYSQVSQPAIRGGRVQQRIFPRPDNNWHQPGNLYHSRTQLEMSSADEDAGLSTPLDKPLLAAVDFAALVTFAGVGKASHSSDGALDIQAVLTTALPFLFAWFATSPFTGIYKDGDDDGGALSAGKVAAKGWIVAIPLGCALRGVIKGYVPPIPFVIVTLIATLVLLGGSRILYSVVENKLNGKEEA
jgi:hypothetical protein